MKSKFLFKVEVCAEPLCGEGCVVDSTGLFLHDYKAATQIKVLLIFPNGTRSTTNAEILYPHPLADKEYYKEILPVYFPNLKSEELPLGTEVYLDSE